MGPTPTDLDIPAAPLVTGEWLDVTSARSAFACWTYAGGTRAPRCRTPSGTSSQQATSRARRSSTGSRTSSTAAIPFRCRSPGRRVRAARRRARRRRRRSGRHPRRLLRDLRRTRRVGVPLPRRHRARARRGLDDVAGGEPSGQRRRGGPGTGALHGPTATRAAQDARRGATGAQRRVNAGRRTSAPSVPRRSGGGEYRAHPRRSVSALSGARGWRHRSLGVARGRPAAGPRRRDRP